jgi:hypothetical protein
MSITLSLTKYYAARCFIRFQTISDLLTNEPDSF